MSNECCSGTLKILKWLGLSFLFLLGFLLVCGLFSVSCAAPFVFALRTVPKYQNYINEERHHVIQTCTNISVQNQGKDHPNITFRIARFIFWSKNG